MIESTESASGLKSCCIVITTFNRPDLLHWNLLHFRDLIVPEGWSIEILIVDNHPQMNSKPVFDELAPSHPLHIRYVAESRPGVSYARNRGIDESRARYIAFIDDDAKVEPPWMVEIAKVLENDGADVVGCRIVLWWEAVEKPSWFNLRCRQLLSEKDYGAIIKPVSSRGMVIGIFCARREIFDRVGHFRTDLGRRENMLLGGEETEWHSRALDSGAKYYYCGTAVSHHWVSEQRITPEYLAAVARGGGHSSLRMDRHTRRALPFRIACWFVSMGFNAMLFYPLRLIFPQHAGRWINHQIRFFRLLGKVEGALSLLFSNTAPHA